MDNASLKRYMHSLFILARVAEVDAANDRYRVDIDGPAEAVRSGWLFRLTSRAGDGGETWHYSVGEQVLVASLTQNLEVGVVMGAINQTAHPPASVDADIYKRKFSDGTEISYDAGASVLAVNAVKDIGIQADGNITVSVTGNATVTADGNVVVNGATIKMNNGAGVVTGQSRCHFNGLPHADCSLVVFAGKEPA